MQLLSQWTVNLSAYIFAKCEEKEQKIIPLYRLSCQPAFPGTWFEK